MKTPDLIDILKEPTETKSILTEENPDDFINPPSDEAPDDDDFDLFNEQKDASNEEPIKQTLTYDDYLENAKMVVGTVDALQTISLPFLYQRSMFTKKERIRLKEIKKMQQSDNEVVLTEEDYQLLDKYDTYLQLKDSVSFTDMESEALVKPLAKIFKKYNMNLGPEVMLFTALATVSFPRFLPLLTPIERM